jgi:hypothetical protein
LRTVELIERDARPGAAFANGTEWDVWSSGWCDFCQHQETCPLIVFAMTNERTPAEWVDDQPGTLVHPYWCTEFAPSEDPDD